MLGSGLMIPQSGDNFTLVVFMFFEAFSSNSLASNPACDRPYTPLSTETKMEPFAFALSRSLYLLMISSGMCASSLQWCTQL